MFEGFVCKLKDPLVGLFTTRGARLPPRFVTEKYLVIGDIPTTMEPQDFVGYKGPQACLVEVKTSRPGKRVDGFRPEGRRGMAPEDIRAASRLGFTMLLDSLELTDNWQAIVTGQEIPID